MAVLSMRVDFPSTKLPDTPANQARIFVFGATAAGQGVQPYANIGRSYANGGVYDLRNPRIPGAISVSPYGAVSFGSESLAGNATLAGQIAYAVEAGYVIVEDAAAPGVALTRDNLMAFI